MELKLDENGNVVVQEGMPVYVDADGKDYPFDMSKNMMRIKDLNQEQKTRRERNEELEEKLKIFDGIDPEEAKKALETVAQLEDSQLMDAKKVKELEDKLKERLAEIFNREKEDLIKEAEGKQSSLVDEIGTHKNTISELMKRNHFYSSPWFTSVNGEGAKTLLLPDMAADIFGKYFRVEGEGADAKFIGYLNNEKIPSQDPARLGDPADFNEAIGIIINQHPRRNDILRSTPGGPGSKNENFNYGENTIRLTKAQFEDPTIYRQARAKSQETGAEIVILDENELR